MSNLSVRDDNYNIAPKRGARVREKGRCVLFSLDYHTAETFTRQMLLLASLARVK